MRSVRKLLATPMCSPGRLAEFTLTTVGILGLIVGLAVLPRLALSEAGFYLALLALVAFMFLSFAAGQLAAIREHLSNRDPN